MVRLIFTQQLSRFLPAPAVIIAAATLRQALAATFSSHPALNPPKLAADVHSSKLLSMFSK